MSSSSDNKAPPSAEKKVKIVDLVISISLILCGCIANNFTLELLMREDSGIGNLLTLLQFLFVAFVGFWLQFDFSKFAMQERKIPIKFYFLITAVFFTLSVINNKAFDFEISQPVHMVFRSSSLISSLLLGTVFFGTKYSSGQTIGVLLVSFGITVVTFAEWFRKVSAAPHKECTNCNAQGAPLSTPGVDESFWNTFSATGIWLIGLSMLTFALFLSSLLGHIQEYTFKTYKATWKESLFYTHLIGTLYFSFFLKDIEHHFNICNNSPLWLLHPLIPPVPTLWVYLLLNCMTQIVCILGVYMLTGAAGTLSCTLTLTVRKFISLVLSIWFFRNPFTIYHWIGGTLVFVGTALYSTAPKPKPKTE